MYRKILVALDGSDLAEAILPHVRSLAQCTGAEIILLRVPEYQLLGSVSPEYGLTPCSFPDDAAIRHEAEGYLTGVIQGLGARGLKASGAVRDGRIAETIVAYACEIQADLIALSARGRGGLARILTGSVVDDVVRDSSVPVLLIRCKA